MTPSPSEDASGGRRVVPPRPDTVRWVLFVGLATLVVLLDQASKAWVDATFALAVPHGADGSGAPTQVLGDLVRVGKVYNDGGIFGLLGSSAPVLGLASIIVIGAILWYELRHAAAASPLLSAALGLLLGGAIGNLLDRLRFGYVVDWVDTGLGSTRWYTFNVADAAIFVSLVLLLAIALLGDRLAPHGRAQGEAGQATGS